MRNRLIAFWKKETVLCVAGALALISMCFVPPNAGYLAYLNLRTLGLLWALMLVMAGLRQLGLFDRLSRALLGRVHNTRQLVLTLVLLPFFAAMFITNDVALLTFAPFALEVLALCGQTALLIPVIALQTIAANLGSMLTPVGNPQNLYLYAASGMRLGAFLALMLPYTLLSLGLLVAASLLLRSKSPTIGVLAQSELTPLRKGKTAAYGAAFVLCLLAVANVLPWQAALAATLVLVLALDRGVLKLANYSLLATFVCFFVLIGNLGELPAVRTLLVTVLAGRETAVSILCSQVMSNVPAAILLSGFTDAWRELIVGVNLGGLGTLIASMASLITYQLLSAEHPTLRGRYLLWFTAANVMFLAILWGFDWLLAIL